MDPAMLWRPESRQSRSNKISQWYIWARSGTTAEWDDNRDWKVDWKCQDRMSCQTYHTCLHPFQRQWWEEQNVSDQLLRKELRGRKIMISRSMDAEERFHHKTLGYIKCCIHTRHSIPLNSISLNWISKYLSVSGQIVVRTCQSGSLKDIKYQDIESEVEEQMEKCLAKKKLVATTVSSREVGQRRRDEGKPTSGHFCIETQRNQRNDK